MNLIKWFKIYSSFSKSEIKKYFAYKANIFMGIIGQVIMVIVTYYLWKAIYSSSQDGIMNGFTLNDMVIYIMISFVIGIVTSNDIRYIISSEVRDGSIAMNLIKPINYEKRLIFIGIGQFIFNFIFLFMPAAIGITIYRINIGLSITSASIILFLLSIVLGTMINIYYSYIFGLLVFKFYSLWGINQIAQAIVMLVSGALIPLSFFPDIIQKLFNFLPFSSIIYTPAMIYLNKLSSNEIIKCLLLQLFWIFVLKVLSRLMWNKVINKLSIQGG